MFNKAGGWKHTSLRFRRPRPSIHSCSTPGHIVKRTVFEVSKNEWQDAQAGWIQLDIKWFSLLAFKGFIHSKKKPNFHYPLLALPYSRRKESKGERATLLQVWTNISWCNWWRRHLEYVQFISTILLPMSSPPFSHHQLIRLLFLGSSLNEPFAWSTVWRGCSCVVMDVHREKSIA